MILATNGFFYKRLLKNLTIDDDGITVVPKCDLWGALKSS
jgi:hypothetical protein